MNNTKALAIAAILIAVTLVVGGTFAATPAQPAFAYKKNGRGQEDGGKNGNTVTGQKNKQDGTQSGFDTSLEQEASNIICTHPNDTATCTQEGVSSTTTPTPTSTPQPTTGTLLIKKIADNVFICTPGMPCCPVGFCAGPSDFTITVTGNNPTPSTFPGSGSGTLVTLDPGEYVIKESLSNDHFEFLFSNFSGDCKGVSGPPVASATGTIAAGEHKTCTIRNTVIFKS
jgi:hypothetical protein